MVDVPRAIKIYSLYLERSDWKLGLGHYSGLVHELVHFLVQKKEKIN